MSSSSPRDDGFALRLEYELAQAFGQRRTAGLARHDDLRPRRSSQADGFDLGRLADAFDA